jgi:hypothetical protein
MKIIKLFLASSKELKEEREKFEIFIYRKCKDWVPQKNIFLHLDIWEDYIDAMALGGLQNEYNKTIVNCDIFVLLAFNKVGPYTSFEFDKAFGEFKSTNKPFIYTYFKKPHTTQNRDEIKSLWEFEDKLEKLNHYKTEFTSIEDFLLKFNTQLDKLSANDFSMIDQSDNNAFDKVYNIQHINKASFK